MPELPEVQTTVDGLNKTIKNKLILDVWSDYHLHTKNKRTDTIKDKKYFEYFKKEIIGEKVKIVKRRGKNILIHLTHNKTILIHMKMTGHFLYGKYAWKNIVWKSDDKFLLDPFNKFVHLLFVLSNGKHLAFSDMRKFAKVTLFETDHTSEVPDLTKLGPEPIPNLSLRGFDKQLLKKPNGKLKTVLMDQTVIAGIGNIYSDEILWTAGLHPERRIESLKNDEVRKLWLATKKILSSSIRMGGDSMSDYRNIYGRKGGFQKTHKVYRRTKEKCLKKNCIGVITRKIIGGRSCHFCNIHQK
jgi:formamidopyrimidine-DNA glycosylase